FQVYEAEINTLNFSPDGQFLVSGDNQGYVQLWSMPHQQQYATWNAHPQSILRQAVFHPDGQVIVSAADDGTIKLWRLDNLNVLFEKSCQSANGATGFADCGDL
ncbi:MAG: hypothetical protein VKL42_13510, partial [Snowella sp.]|nr:hypothetical protein [Snowella sp.]